MYRFFCIYFSVFLASLLVSSEAQGGPIESTARGAYRGAETTDPLRRDIVYGAPVETQQTGGISYNSISDGVWSVIFGPSLVIKPSPYRIGDYVFLPDYVVKRMVGHYEIRRPISFTKVSPQRYTNLAQNHSTMVSIGSGRSYENPGVIFMDLAEKARAAGDLDKALEYIREALEMDTSNEQIRASATRIVEEIRKRDNR